MKVRHYYLITLLLILTMNANAFEQASQNNIPQNNTNTTTSNTTSSPTTSITATTASPTSNQTSTNGTNANNNASSNTINGTTLVPLSYEKCVPLASDFTIILISFSPLILFLIIFTFVFTRLKKEDYKISDSLKENETIKVSMPNPLSVNPAPGEAPPPFIDKNIQPKSSSRLIAFITGLTTLGIASSLCCFWLYTYIKCGFAPKLDDITNVLLTLGLGVVPYAFNKISSTFK